jgi:DNA replication initiation complex subunit (GINS family)
MITYSEFLRIRRQEQEDDTGITKFTDQLLADMNEYIAINKNSLEEAKKMGDQMRSDELSTQIKNAINTLEQILNIRMIKLAHIAILGVNIDVIRSNLLSSELVLFDRLTEIVNEHKSKIIGEAKNVAPKKLQKVETDDKTDKAVIKIIADVPKFIWRNDKAYGPFGFPNVIEIDKDVADILIKSGKAVDA